MMSVSTYEQQDYQQQLYQHDSDIVSGGAPVLMEASFPHETRSSLASTGGCGSTGTGVEYQNIQQLLLEQAARRKMLERQ